MATSVEALTAANTSIVAYGDARAQEALASAPVSSGTTGQAATSGAPLVYTQAQHDADIAAATEALKSNALILEQNVETVMAVLKASLQPVVGTVPKPAPVTGDQSAASGATATPAAGASTPITTQSFVGQVKQ